MTETSPSLDDWLVGNRPAGPIVMLLRERELALRDQAANLIDALCNWHRQVEEHWGDGAHGWAPPEASAVLERSRHDRQTSLCQCLALWLEPTDDEGRLILAWANLGAVVEGTLKLFLSVWAHDYQKTPITIRKRPVEPDEPAFDKLRQFFKEQIWLDSQAHWDAWLWHVQQHRNAIHAYKDIDVGTHDHYLSAVVGYARLVTKLDSQIPWWDGY